MASVMTNHLPQVCPQSRDLQPEARGEQLPGPHVSHACGNETNKTNRTDQGRRGGRVSTRAHAEKAADTCAKLLALKLELSERLEQQQLRNNRLLHTLQEKAKASGLLESLAKGKADVENKHTLAKGPASPAVLRSPSTTRNVTVRHRPASACTGPTPPSPNPTHPPARRATRHSVDGCVRPRTSAPSSHGGFTHVFGEPLGSSTSAPVNEISPAMLEPIRTSPTKADSEMHDSDLPLLRWLLDSSSPLSPTCQAPPSRTHGPCSDVSHILVQNDADSVADGAPSHDIFPDFFDPLENFTTDVEPLYGRQLSTISNDPANNNQHSTLGPLLCFSKRPPLATPLDNNTALHAPTGLDPARSRSFDDAMAELQNMLKDSGTECSDNDATQHTLRLDDWHDHTHRVDERPRLHRTKAYRASMSQIPDGTPPRERRFSSGQLSLGSRSPARMALGPNNGQRWPPARLTARRQSTPALMLPDSNTHGSFSNPEPQPRVAFRRSMQFPLAPSPQPALKRRVSSRGDFSTDDQQPPSRRVSSRGVPGDDLTPLTLAYPDSQPRRFSSCGSPVKSADGPPVHVLYKSWADVGEFIFSDHATMNSTFEAVGEPPEPRKRCPSSKPAPAPSSSTSMTTTTFSAHAHATDSNLAVHSLDSNILDSYVSGASGGGGSQAASHAHSDHQATHVKPPRTFYSHSEGMSADDEGVAMFDSFDSTVPTHCVQPHPRQREPMTHITHGRDLDYDCLMTMGT